MSKNIGVVDERAREALRKIMEAHRFNVAGMTVTEVHAICFDALTAPAPNHSEQVREVPDGWQLVPVEPTEAMIGACLAHSGVTSGYKAMLAAAPSAGSQGGDV